MEYLQYFTQDNIIFLYDLVLNLIINGIPSILYDHTGAEKELFMVLNLIINGIPSIQKIQRILLMGLKSFKPYYKWNTFNTAKQKEFTGNEFIGFKPYYKWNTFNTTESVMDFGGYGGFKPYYKWNTFNTLLQNKEIAGVNPVLNLIINGIPSILQVKQLYVLNLIGFKPYYKWNTFNTLDRDQITQLNDSFKPYYKWNTFNTVERKMLLSVLTTTVLNLIINGIPSILKKIFDDMPPDTSFKPYYKWNTFNTGKRVLV